MLVHSGKSDGKKQHFGNEHAHSVTWALVSVRVGTRGEDAAAVWEGDCTGEFGGRRMCVCVRALLVPILVLAAGTQKVGTKY